MPSPLVDRQDYVMAVVARAPKNDTEWWRTITKQATQDLTRLYRNYDFTHLGERESFVEFGLGFGDDWAGPHNIDNYGVDGFDELQYVQQSEPMKAISAYQNHIYRHFFPKIHADVSARINQLLDRQIVAMPFEESVFTTCEISFCDAPRPSRKNLENLFYGIEVITSLGDYEGGGVVFAEDERVIPLPPGSTVAFPSGSKRYTFEAIAPHETRILIRQFCHAGILRWVDKGGRADFQFERDASAAEKTAWEAYRMTRGQTSAKLFSKLGEIYVV
ncbi:hypothetical protein B0H11DRAFT_2245001 [Mycena galericulata]|nr:hypothetical protein B0H11DRAFT_2245001 [Mycena galericulata]